MDLDRRHLDRRRFLALGGMAAVAAACTSSSGEDAAPPTARDAAPVASSSPTTGAAAAPATTELSSTTTPTDGSPASAAPTDGEALAAFRAADFEGIGACALLADTTAGPFPNPTRLDRRDVTEGYPGHPLRLGLRLIDGACEPVPGAVVEIWHADASGDYSSYDDGGGGKDEGADSAFMRGLQTAGDDGIVEFHTIYPGWYRGRAVHIHLSVHVDGRTALTSQLFFDDTYSEQVHAAEPYVEFGPPDTPNAADRIAGPVIATGGLLTLAPGATAAGAGTVALTNLGVSV
jgi:protocatechuate 3,4-dioxygenase beta subunit